MEAVAPSSDVISVPSVASDAENDPALSQGVGAEIVVSVSSFAVHTGGQVVFAYEVHSGTVGRLVLRLSVCGVELGPSDGWHVMRKPRSCTAVGTHVCTLPVVAGYKYGLAVSPDELVIVVGLSYTGTLSVYSLPGGQLVRTFGGPGSGPLQFSYMRRLCFVTNDAFLVADTLNRRLQEVTVGGELMRIIGERAFNEGNPFAAVFRDGVIVVGCGGEACPRVVLFDYSSGAVTSWFGEVGILPGQLSNWCTGIRFTPDGGHLVIAESQAKRVSVFTTAGVFVKCVGVGTLEDGLNDVVMTSSGEFVVADAEHNRVCVFSPDGLELVRSWGSFGPGDGEFDDPTALALVGEHLYVLDCESERVQVFE